jgi:mRNA-degrading endonuclease RelE of RelBE toxin-antitoxin system
MRLTLIQLSTFAAKWRKLRLTDDDLRKLEEELIADPECGDVIPGTGGLRKIRFAPIGWGRGKRGASRVVYAFIVAGDVVYLFTVYGKNEQSDLLPEEKRTFRQVLEQLQRRHRMERD